MSKPLINIYVDAPNFYQQQEEAGTRIDLQLFPREVARRLDGRVGVMHYFTAPASWARGSVRDRQNAFFRRVDSFEGVDLHVGRHVRHPGRDGEVEWVQRGTTAKLAARLALDASADSSAVAVVVVGNTEYAEAIEEVRRATGAEVVWGHFPNQRGLVPLFEATGRDLEFDAGFLKAVALHRSVHLRDG